MPPVGEGLAGEGLSPQVEENVRMIRESVELEVQLIDDLLDLTKISRYAASAQRHA